jgi:hypothetical protein
VQLARASTTQTSDRAFNVREKPVIVIQSALPISSATIGALVDKVAEQRIGAPRRLSTPAAPRPRMTDVT